ncbi:MAG: hypothetical protein GY862_35720 [Gammaproteobacteria bacterium]|nr:hypothetical protein [Gammaproteobacteria bacterium]
MEEFFQHLTRGESFKSAFEKATEMVELSTRRGGNPANFFNGFQDLALQHPLLDDNGDGLGSNVLTHGGDGDWSENLYLGVGVDLHLGAGVDHLANPLGSAEIISTTDTLFPGLDESSAVLFINVNSAHQVDKAPVYIRRPSTVLPRDGQEHTEQLEIDELEQVPGDLISAPGEILSLGGLAWYAGLPRFSSREYEAYQDDGETIITVERDGIGEMTVDFNIRESETDELYQEADQLRWAEDDYAPKTLSVQIHTEDERLTEDEKLILSLDNLTDAAGVVHGRVDAAWLLIRPIPVTYVEMITEESFILEIDSGAKVTEEPDSAIVKQEFDGDGNLVLIGVSPGYSQLKLHNDTASTKFIVDITVSPKEPCPASSDDGQSILIDVSCNAFGLVYNDVELAEGVKVFNMEVTGTVKNAGTVFNLTLREQGDFSGGTLSGSVINLGKVADVVFDQVIFVGGTLAGTASGTGRVQGVELATGTQFSGVTVAGSIRGDADAPAFLENVFVNAGARLANVVLGEKVRFEDKMPVGENIQFISVDVIPMELDLLKIFPEQPGEADCMGAVTGNPRRDLSATIVQDKPALLDAINAIPLLQKNSWVFEQEPHFAYLRLDVGEVRFEQQVMSIKRAAADAGAELLNQQGVRFITESGLEAVSQPALQAPCILQAIAAEVDFPEIEIQANGNLRIPGDAGTWFSVRSGWISDVLSADAEPGLSADESSYSAAASGKLAFMDAEEQLREQLLYPAPAHPEAFPVNESLEFGPYGWLSFEPEGQRRYQGVVDYWVMPGENAAKILRVNSAGDVNGDGLADFTLRYPGGDSQTLFGVKEMKRQHKR